MPNVLYHDIQASVQNAFFTAVKFKALFPNKQLYLYQIGSDPVEHLFRSIRTQNHDRNCDILQLESRLSRAAVLDKIFMKHPDWKHKSNTLEGKLFLRKLIPLLSMEMGQDSCEEFDHTQ